MSVFGFYVEVNLGCVCILMLLLYSIKRLPTPQLKYTLFQNLILWHIIYFISDSAWALVNDNVLPKNVITVLVVNYLNVVIMPVVAYSCFIFAEIGTRTDMTRKQIERFRFKLIIPIVLQALALLVTFCKFPDFWLDDNWNRLTSITFCCPFCLCAIGLRRRFADCSVPGIYRIARIFGHTWWWRVIRLES